MFSATADALRIFQLPVGHELTLPRRGASPLHVEAILGAVVTGQQSQPNLGMFQGFLRSGTHILAIENHHFCLSVHH